MFLLSRSLTTHLPSLTLPGALHGGMDGAGSPSSLLCSPPPALPDLFHLEELFCFNLPSFGHFLHKPPGPGHLLGCPSPT